MCGSDKKLSFKRFNCVDPLTAVLRQECFVARTSQNRSRARLIFKIEGDDTVLRNKVFMARRESFTGPLDHQMHSSY